MQSFTTVELNLLHSTQSYLCCGRAIGVNTITQSKILLAPFYYRICQIMRSSRHERESRSRRSNLKRREGDDCYQAYSQMPRKRGCQICLRYSGRRKYPFYRRTKWFINSIHLSSSRASRVVHGGHVRPCYWQCRRV